MRFFMLMMLFASSVFAGIGTVMALRGTAEIHRGSAVIPAHIGDSIEQADTIATAEKSRVQVMLEDETVVTIGAKSVFSFEEYSFNGANSKVNMRAKRGFFRAVTGKISKLAPQRFKVKTSSATIGIRGTDFWGEIGTEKEIIGCNYGKIYVVYNGLSNDIESGEYVEIHNQTIERKTFRNTLQTAKQTQGKEKTSQTQEEESLVEDTVIVQEDIADVTQNQNEALEPFGFNLNGEDREQEY